MAKTFVFKTIQDAVSIIPEVETVFNGAKILSICKEIGLNFDHVFSIQNNWDKQEVEILQTIFIEPLVFDENIGVKTCIARIIYKFNRIKNEQIESSTILNVLMAIENNTYTHFEYWVPGTTIVDLSLYKDIRPFLLASSQYYLSKELGVPTSEQALEVYKTEVKEFDEKIGWTEEWHIMDITTKKTAVVIAKFENTEDGGVKFDIST